MSLCLTGRIKETPPGTCALHPVSQSHTVMLDTFWVSPGHTAAVHVGEQQEQTSEGQTSFSSLSMMSSLRPRQVANLPGQQVGSTDNDLHPSQQGVSHCNPLLLPHDAAVGLRPNQLGWCLPLNQTYSRHMSFI